MTPANSDPPAPPTKAPIAVPTKGIGIKEPSAPPIQVPSPEPIALNAALPTGSPANKDRANSNTPPMTGTLLTSGATILSAALVPPLPRTPTVALLARFVALERAYLPPKLLTPCSPNLLVAAFLPNRCAYLLAACDEVVRVLPALLPLIPVLPPLRPPRPPPPNPPNDLAPNANVNTVMATSIAFITASKAPSNPIPFIIFLVPS